MKRYFQFVLACLCFAAFPARALVIDSITTSTVAGYSETYSPGADNRFWILGVPLTYNLSNGKTASFGAGVMGLTNGTITSEQLTGDGRILYEFGTIYNGVKGDGVLFYHRGQVWDPDLNLWTEGELLPASPLVLEAPLGSSTAVISGLATVLFNNPSNNWGDGYFDFISYAAPEGTVVPFSATYTLLNGATWGPGIFDSSFEYQLTGTISFVPEPNSLALAVLGFAIALMGNAIRKGRNRRVMFRRYSGTLAQPALRGDRELPPL